MIRLINILARRLRVIYLDRRSHRATLILFNLIDSIKTLFRDRSIIVTLVEITRSNKTLKSLSLITIIISLKRI